MSLDELILAQAREHLKQVTELLAIMPAGMRGYAELVDREAKLKEHIQLLQISSSPVKEYCVPGIITERKRAEFKTALGDEIMEEI